MTFPHPELAVAVAQLVFIGVIVAVLIHSAFKIFGGRK